MREKKRPLGTGCNLFSSPVVKSRISMVSDRGSGAFLFPDKMRYLCVKDHSKPWVAACV